MSDSYTTPTGEWVGDSLPTVINAERIVSYTVADIVGDIMAERKSSDWVDSLGRTGGTPRSLEVTLEEVLERIAEWAKDDLACEYGHAHDLTGVIFTDETGREVDA